MKLGPEWVGRLLPEAQEQIDRSLNGWRASGQVIGIELLAGSGCPVATRMQGLFFRLDSAPQLPIEGCTRAPCCGCCFIAVLDDETGEDAKPVRESIRQLPCA